MPAFLLSPADCRGKRAALLVRPGASFPLAVALREGRASIGQVFAFVSGLYFRGKLAYAERFGGLRRVIVPGRGLLDPGLRIGVDHVAAFAEIDADADEPAFVAPLTRDARDLAGLHDGDFVLLGSVATRKYVEPLSAALGARLRYPVALRSLGDKARGKLLLDRAASGEELEYGALHDGAGARPSARQRRRPPRTTDETAT